MYLHCQSKTLPICCSHREHQEAVEELKRKGERNRTLLEEENKKLQADIDKVNANPTMLRFVNC